jgi:hypothetical protein
MTTFYVEGKVDLKILIDIFGNARVTENVYCICLIFSLVLFILLKMMFVMTTMLSKIQYTKNMF